MLKIFGHSLLMFAAGGWAELQPAGLQLFPGLAEVCSPLLPPEQLQGHLQLPHWTGRAGAQGGPALPAEVKIFQWEENISRLEIF